jgi:hypothetical protein
MVTPFEELAQTKKNVILVPCVAVRGAFGNTNHVEMRPDTPVYHIIIISVTILLLCESSESVIK